MRQFLSDVSLFIYTTLSYWQALATGGIVTGMVGVFERLSGHHLTKRAYLALFVGTFLLAAFFLGWREEHTERLRQEAALNKMLSNKPQLDGHFEFFNMGTNSKLPEYVAVAMIMSIANVGSSATIADRWDCRLAMRNPQGAYDVVKGEFRSFPEGLVLPRGTNQPMVFEREDALYIKTMRTPIAPGAKVMGAMLCVFPKASTKNITSSEDNTLLVSFHDVLGGEHQATLRYLNEPGMRYNMADKGEWVDLPGMEHPLAAPPTSPPTPKKQIVR